MIKDVMQSKNPYVKYTTYAMIGLAIFVIIVIIMKIIQAAKAGSTALGDLAGAQIIAAQTGISPDRQLICKQVADDARTAVSYLWFTHTVIGIDSKNFANALNRLTTPQEAALTSQYYRDNVGDSLASVANQLGGFTSIFSDSVSINSTILNSLT